METIKNCKTCAHRFGGVQFGKCLLSGYYCSTERMYPSQCGKNYENWVQRPDSLFKRIVKSIFRIK